MKPTGDEYEAGRMRRITNGRVEICHRLTSVGVSPERWSCWEVWADLFDDTTALLAHEWACKNGPWGNPHMPPNAEATGNRRRVAP